MEEWLIVPDAGGTILAVEGGALLDWFGSKSTIGPTCLPSFTRSQMRCGDGSMNPASGDRWRRQL
jgi:hypothetical protein